MAALNSGGSWIPELPDTQTMHLIGGLENGKVVTIFFAKTRPERRTLAVKQTTSQLVWIRAQGARPEGASMSALYPFMFPMQILQYVFLSCGKMPFF